MPSNLSTLRKSIIKSQDQKFMKTYPATKHIYNQTLVLFETKNLIYNSESDKLNICG